MFRKPWSSGICFVFPLGSLMRQGLTAISQMKSSQYRKSFICVTCKGSKICFTTPASRIFQIKNDNSLKHSKIFNFYVFQYDYFYKLKFCSPESINILLFFSTRPTTMIVDNVMIRYGYVGHCHWSYGR